MLYAKVSEVNENKVKFKLLTINLMFKDEDSLNNAKDAEFCILSRFIAFKFLNEEKVRVLKIPKEKKLTK